MPRRELGVEILRYFCTPFFCSLPPPFPKREVAQGLKRRSKRILAFPSRRRRDTREVSSYGGVATLRGKTEESSCPEGKRGSRINFQEKVGSQENQSSRKLLQQYSREQEIGREEAPNFLEGPT